MAYADDDDNDYETYGDSGGNEPTAFGRGAGSEPTSLLENEQFKKSLICCFFFMVILDLLLCIISWRAICEHRLKFWVVGKYIVPLCSFLACLLYGPCLCAFAARSPHVLYSSVGQSSSQADKGSSETEALHSMSGVPDYSIQDSTFWANAFISPQVSAQHVAEDSRVPWILRLYLSFVANICDKYVLEVLWFGYGAIALSKDSYVCSRQSPILYYYVFFQVMLGCLSVILMVIYVLGTQFCPEQLSVVVAMISNLPCWAPMTDLAQKATNRIGGGDGDGNWMEAVSESSSNVLEKVSTGVKRVVYGSGYNQFEMRPLTETAGGDKDSQGNAVHVKVASGSGGSYGGTGTTAAIGGVSSPPAAASSSSTAGAGAGATKSADDDIDITVVHDDDDDDNDNDEANTCGMCHAALDSNDQNVRVLKCGHEFHKSCVDVWPINKGCPVCKRERKRKRQQQKK